MGGSSSPPPKRPRQSTSGLVLGSAGRVGPGGRPPVHGGQASVSVHTNNISNVGGARSEVVGGPRRAEVAAGGVGTGEMAPVRREAPGNNRMQNGDGRGQKS